MTEEELREKIADQLRIDCSFWGQPTPTYEMMADSILDLIREAGWKSGEEVDKISSDSWSDGFEAGQDSYRED